MGKIGSFQECVSFSRMRKDRLPRVIAILSSRASQPIAQSKTGASHSIFFLRFGRVDPPLPFSAFQIAPAVVPISPCIIGYSFSLDLPRLAITETASKTPFGRNRASQVFPLLFQAEDRDTALGAFQRLILSTFLAKPELQDGALVWPRPGLPTTVMKKKPFLTIIERRRISCLHVSRKRRPNPPVFRPATLKSTECQGKDQTH